MHWAPAVYIHSCCFVWCLLCDLFDTGFATMSCFVCICSLAVILCLLKLSVIWHVMFCYNAIHCCAFATQLCNFAFSSVAVIWHLCHLLFPTTHPQTGGTVPLGVQPCASAVCQKVSDALSHCGVVYWIGAQFVIYPQS